MFCTACGKPVTGEKFCGSCGAALAVTVGASPSSVEIVSETSRAAGFAFTPNLAMLEESYTAPRVTFGEAITAGFKGYVIWNARSTRAEFWWWTLFAGLTGLAALAIDSVLTAGLLYVVWLFGSFLPSLSVLIRRLHDLDRSGGWYWIGLIPLVGGIVLLVFMCTESLRRPTRWNRNLVLELRARA